MKNSSKTCASLRTPVAHQVRAEDKREVSHERRLAIERLEFKAMRLRAILDRVCEVVEYACTSDGDIAAVLNDALNGANSAPS